MSCVSGVRSGAHPAPDATSAGLGVGFPSASPSQRAALCLWVAGHLGGRPGMTCACALPSPSIAPQIAGTGLTQLGYLNDLYSTSPDSDPLLAAAFQNQVAISKNVQATFSLFPVSRPPRARMPLSERRRPARPRLPERNPPPASARACLLLVRVRRADLRRQRAGVERVRGGADAHIARPGRLDRVGARHGGRVRRERRRQPRAVVRDAGAALPQRCVANARSPGVPTPLLLPHLFARRDITGVTGVVVQSAAWADGNGCTTWG